MTRISMMKAGKNIWSKLAVASGLAVLAVLQTGCSANFGALSSAGPQTAANSGVALSGIAKGGQPPVTGATIQLYAVGTNGYGSNATPLLSGTPVTTNANGGFTLASGSYTCPANSYVYITASSGNPGLSANNTSLALMAALGLCSGLSSTTFITINELTTVAAVWSMAQFGATTGAALSTSSYTGVPTDTFGTSSTNVQGIANAMAMANVLVNTATGTSPGVNTTGNQINVEYWHINTIANILASCVNSVGAASSGCTTLFNNTSNTVGTTAVPASDTIQAALSMAKSPAANVSNLTALSSAYAQFAPTDTATSDFTIGLSFGTGTSATRWIAIDQFGNAWVATGTTNVYELDPTGNIIATPTTYTVGTTATTIKNSYEVAIDTANNAWFSDMGTTTTANNIFQVPGSTSAGGAPGTALTGYSTGTYTSGTTTVNVVPYGLGVDGSNNIWYAGSSTAMFELPAGNYGAQKQGSNTTVSPYGLAIDLSNNPNSPNYALSGGASFVYAANSGGCSGKVIAGSTGTEGSLDMVYDATFTSGTTSITPGTATPVQYIADATCGTTSQVAIQNSNNLSSAPYGLAFDNSNNLWIVNQNYVQATATGAKNSVTKATLNYSLGFTPATINSAVTFTNYSGGGQNAAYYISMDGASSPWMSNVITATAAVASTSNAIPQGTVTAYTNAGVPLSPAANATSTTFPNGGFIGGVYTLVNGSTTQTFKRAINASRYSAIDPSGNMWITNTSTFAPSAPVTSGTATAVGFVTVMVGAAVPTTTPLSRGIAACTTGTCTLAAKP